MTPDPLAAIPNGLFEGYPPDLRPHGLPQPLGNAGGLSGSRFWRFEAMVGPILLRRWPAGAAPDRLATVHQWVARLHAAIPEVALPLADHAGRSFVERDGDLWELTRFLPGVADLRVHPDPSRLATMFATLARAHAALGDEPTLALSPGLIARRDELRQLIAWEFDHFGRVLALDPYSDARWHARRWLEGARLLAGRMVGRVAAVADRVIPLQPVLRDVRPDHFLFEQNRLTGLVDFGAMGVDSVASDLARLLGETSAPNSDPRRSALAAYQAVRLLTAEELDLIGDFEAANAVLGGARWVRWHFVEHRQFDDSTAAERGLLRAEMRLSHLY